MSGKFVPTIFTQRTTKELTSMQLENKRGQRDWQQQLEKDMAEYISERKTNHKNKKEK